MPVKAQFVALFDRQFLTLEPRFVEIAGELAFADPPGDVEGAIVRVRYAVTEAEARRINQAKIQDDLLALGAQKVILQPKLVREQQVRAEGLDESLGPLDALALWLEAQSLNGAQGGAALQALLGRWLEAEA